MASSVPSYAGTTELAPASRNISWSGISAGTFLYLAIEATFGALASAIFAPGMQATNPRMTVGAGIWMIVLTGFAMYFAGRLAARIAGAATRPMGMRMGVVTFGMSIFSTILVIGMMLGGSGAEAGSVASSQSEPRRVA